MSEKENLEKYELTFILGEKADQEQASAKSAELKKRIEELGGSIIKEDLWGRRELAYPIKRNRSGFYVTLIFDLPARALNGFTQPLRFDESLIRTLVTKAYTTAQPGTLYPQAEETAEVAKPAAEETASAEEMLRRSASPKKEKAAATEPVEDELPEEERMKKLDETLEEMLKEEA